MFHVGIGATVGCDQIDPRMLRAWESKFSGDPLIFVPDDASSPAPQVLPFPYPLCEIKLFRDYAGLLEGVPFDILPAQRGCRILLLGIPASVDFEEMIKDRMVDIRYYSVLRRSHGANIHDSDRSAILVFNHQSGADMFFRDWHLQFFDPEASGGPVCYLAYVDKLFVDSAESDSFNSLLPFGSQQIPSCPFCIERIDLHVSGLVTSRRGWLSSGLVYSSSCVACSKLADSELSCCNAKSGLWLCLLCGNVGCGRYEKAHAEKHSKSSNHRLSLEISTGRIWDYLDDLFVHRRIVSQPSAPILDLPERIDPSTLPVYPQVSFEEDIRELDSTMDRQLAYERSKYEEACTQLKALGKSRIHEEEALLFNEKREEESLRNELLESRKTREHLQFRLREMRAQAQKKEKVISKQKKTYKESFDKFQRLESKNVPTTLPRAKLEELDRLEKEADELRNRISSL